MTALDMVLAARASGELGPLCAAIPYARHLGITMARHDGELRACLRFGPHLIGNSLIPALHGGTLGALLETTAMLSVLVETETVQIPKTISINLEFLRTGRAQDTWARAEPTKLGRRLASVRVYAWQENRQKPIAAATVTLLLRPPTDPVGSSSASGAPPA